MAKRPIDRFTDISIPLGSSMSTAAIQSEGGQHGRNRRTTYVMGAEDVHLLDTRIVAPSAYVGGCEAVNNLAPLPGKVRPSLQPVTRKQSDETVESLERFKRALKCHFDTSTWKMRSGKQAQTRV